MRIVGSDFSGTIAFIVIAVFLFCFASFFQYKDRQDPFIENKPSKTNSIEQLLNKLTEVINAPIVSIKWRMCLITSMIITGLFFTLILNVSPTIPMLIGTFSITFLSILTMIKFHCDHIQCNTIKYGELLIDSINKKTNQKLRNKQNNQNKNYTKRVASNKQQKF